MASCTMHRVIQILELMGHVTPQPCFLAAGGRPLPDQATLCQLYVAYGSRLALYESGRQTTTQGKLRPPQPEGSLRRLDAITQLAYATRTGVLELTLFVHLGLGGRIDIQAPPDTPIATLLHYVATLIGVSPARVDLVHAANKSIADVATELHQVPGSLSAAKSVRWISYLADQSVGDAIPLRAIAFQNCSRSDVR